MVAASVVTARAALARLAANDEPVGARRSFLYPPLVASYVPLAALFTVWPALISVFVATDVPAVEDYLARRIANPPLPALCLTGIALGLWWTALGLVCRVGPKAVRAIFFPFADWFERRHAVRITLLGLLVIGTSAALFAVVANR